MNKKIGMIVLFSFIISSMLIGMVSAQYWYSIRQGSSQAVDLVVDFEEPILRAVFGGDQWSGFFLFEKFLLFILVEPSLTGTTATTLSECVFVKMAFLSFRS